MPRVGIGLYPGDACFDPNRGSLQPYYIDTWNEGWCKFDRCVFEGDCKEWFGSGDTRMNFPPPNGGYPPTVPEGGYSTNPGEITQEEVLEAQRRESEEWRKTAIPNPPGGEKRGFSLLAVAAIGVGAWLFVESRK